MAGKNNAELLLCKLFGLTTAISLKKRIFMENLINIIRNDIEEFHLNRKITRAKELSERKHPTIPSFPHLKNAR